MSTLQTINGSDLPTNSRADINGNFATLNSGKLETSVLDTDTALTANSDAKVATQKAVKAYVDGVGVATATTTIKGIVEVATQAQTLAGTALGETGASIVVTPETLKGITTPVIQKYENSGSPHTWTKPTGLKYVVVEVLGGGGGGGGANDTTYDEAGNGGGGGGYSRKIIESSSLGATETVTVGAGGAGGAVGGGTGATGGTSSFGAHCSATGGTGGQTSSSALAGEGGIGSSGSVNTAGDCGSRAGYNGASADVGSGSGGGSYMGGGGLLRNTVGTGNVGKNYGGGGGGGFASSGQEYAGGEGAQGVVIVTEYYV